MVLLVAEVVFNSVVDEGTIQQSARQQEEPEPAAKMQPSERAPTIIFIVVVVD